MLKRATQNLFKICGFTLLRNTSIPFGFDWTTDLRWLAQKSEFKVAFDVGANLGQSALALDKAFADCKIYSFEPVLETFESMCQNVRARENIEPHHCAMSSKRGKCTMTAEPLSPVNRLLTAEADDFTGSTETVAMDTVAGFCRERNIVRIDLLKIDTEGHELEVLAGAKDLFEQGLINTVFIECEFSQRSDEPHVKFNDIFEFLTKYDFVLVAFYSAGVDNLGWRWGNALFWHATSEDSGRVFMSPYD